MKLCPSDECAAGHGPVPRKIEALNTGSTCPSRDGDKWGKERQAGEVGIPRASPVGNKLNQEQYQSCTETPQYGVASPYPVSLQLGFGSSWGLAVAVEGAGTGRADAGTDLSEINMCLLWRPLGAALAQRWIIYSSHSFRSPPLGFQVGLSLHQVLCPTTEYGA